MATKGLNSAITADSYVALKPELVVRDKDCFLHTGTHHKPTTRSSFAREVASFIGNTFQMDDATSRLVDETVDAIGHRTAIEKGWQPYWIHDASKTASVLVVQNGILDLSPMYDGGDAQLLPHTPTLFATTISDFSYDPTRSDCPRFLDFMSWMTEGDSDTIQLLLQFMAYTLLRGLNFQQFLILVGTGSNGKSTLLNTIGKFVGAGNFAALPIERLGQRFALASLFDKAINLCAGLNETDKVSEGNLKMLVDDSGIAFERKFRDVFTGRNFARLIFACNQLPRFRDRTDGLWRRMLVVPCSATVEPDEVVRRVEDTFDMTGVLNLVLAAGKQLIEQGGFTIPEVVSRTTNQERVEMNPTKLFLIEHCTADSKTDVPVEIEILFLAYKSWMESRRYMPMADGNFGKELKTHFAEEFKSGVIKKGKTRGTSYRRNCYWGLKYWPNGIDDSEDDFDEVAREQAQLFVTHPIPF